jgi:hypothetical protein
LFFIIQMKLQAVEDEDYDLAKQLKQDIDAMRSQIDTRLAGDDFKVLDFVTIGRFFLF